VSESRSEIYEYTKSETSSSADPRTPRLSAIDRRYFRKAKSLHRLFPDFTACPANAWQRLIDGLREADPMKGAAILLTLAGDIIRLVEPPELVERRAHCLRICMGWAEEYGIAN